MRHSRGKRKFRPEGRLEDMASRFDPFAPRDWKLAHGRSLTLGPQAIVMAIVNVTPDSFSDGGLFVSVEAALDASLRMIGDGAQIVDIGGESTRPGATPVSAATEQERVLPLIEALARRSDVLISVDTYRAETARLAIAAGAHIVNDVWGFQRDPEIARATFEADAGAVIMHTGRERQRDEDVIADQHGFLDRSLSVARAAGLADERLVLDPGFGFAKTADENLDLMARFGELHAFELPLLAGTSRKRFVGALSGRDEPEARDAATAATSVILRMAGAAIFRVHDVAINRDALAVADAMVARLCRRKTESERCPSTRST